MTAAMATADLQDRVQRLEADADRAAARGDLGAARRLLSDVTAAAPDRGEVWLKLAAMCRAQGDLPAALEAVSGALRVEPLGFMPLLLKASLLDAAGRSEEAGEAYGHALAQRPAEIPPHLQAPIARAERVHAEHVARIEANLGARVVGLEDRLTDAEARRLDRFKSNVLRRTRPWHCEPTHFHYPGLVEREFHDPEAFPWLPELEAATPVIADEFRQLMEGERAELVPYIQYSEDMPLRQWRELNWNKAWTAVHLLQNGERVEANARHCPETMALLGRIGQPAISGRSPNAMFSLLAPHTRIPPHTGVANTRLVCHLPLVVPEGCWFRVGAETRGWEVGKAFVFDDTIEHEAANDGDRLRVVLIFDLWHPGLSPAEREAVGAVMAGTDLNGEDPPAEPVAASPSPPARVPAAGPVAPTPAAIEEAQKRRAKAAGLAKGGDHRAALAEFREVLRLVPNDPDVAADTGIVARRCAQEEEVLPLVCAAAEAHPNHARIWQVRGLLQRALEDLAPAIEAFDRAAMLAPRDPLIAHSRARAFFDAGLPSIAPYEQALRLAPDDSSAMIGLISALVADGRHDEAVRRLEAELAKRPDWVEAHSVLARYRWSMGDQTTFTAEMERALARSPRNIELWRELILALLKAERFEDCLAAIERGRAAMGPHLIFDANEAASHAELGHVERADELFDALRPVNDVSVTIRHVRHLMQTARFDQAEQLASTTIGTPAVSGLWPYLAAIWRKIGDPRWEWLEGDPRLVGVYDLGDSLPPLDPLAERLRALHIAVHQPLEQSLRGGTQTDGALFHRVEPEIRALRKAIVEAVRGHIGQLPPHDPDHPQLSLRRDTIRFSGSWSVRLLSGGRHVNHIHPQGWFSSALYVALPPPEKRGPEPAGWLSHGEPSDELKMDLPPIRLIEPKPGRLALFPSTMWHGTKPFAEGERLTVAFDVAPPL